MNSIKGPVDCRIGIHSEKICRYVFTFWRSGWWGHGICLGKAGLNFKKRNKKSLKFPMKKHGRDKINFLMCSFLCF